MARDDISPQRIDESHRSGAFDEYKLVHPAFAQIAVRRTSGNRTLYGSEFQHQHYVSISIQASEEHRHLNQSWHHTTGPEIIEVSMSEHQFSQMVASMNVGSGTPCTLSRYDGKLVPGIKQISEHEKARTDARRIFEDQLKANDLLITEFEGEAHKMSVAARTKVLELLKRNRSALESSMSFAMTQFEEHMEATTEAAKTEIHAHANNFITRMGLAHIDEMKALTGTGDQREPSPHIPKKVTLVLKKADK